jgi:hypothetical protein
VLAGVTVTTPEALAATTLLEPFATETEKVLGLAFFAKVNVEGADNEHWTGVEAGVGVGD